MISVILSTTFADNPEGYFPTYEPSEERLAEIKAKYAEDPLNLHYNASDEVRAKGAAFYQFSGDEETRRQQMEELKKAREETEKTREESGAVNVRPGEVEGMIAPEGSASRSKALEKRKRDIEERRKMLDAKRRKKDPGLLPVAEQIQQSSKPSSSPSPGPQPPPSRQSDTHDHEHVNPSTRVSTDPFATLEAKVTEKKGKMKAQPSMNQADAFLASLEKDIMKGMR